MKISSNTNILSETDKMQKLNKNHRFGSNKLDSVSFTSRDEFTSYDDSFDVSIFDLIDETYNNLQINEWSNKYYSDEINLARKLINEQDVNTRRELIYEDRYEVLKEEKGILEPSIARAVLAILTFGASEVIQARDTINCKSKAEKWIDKIELIRTDLITARANETAAEAMNQDKLAELKAKHIQVTTNIKENIIRNKFLDLIQAKKEGVQVEIPNCIMFVNKDDNINEQFINWTIKDANVESKTIDIFNDDLLDVLEEAEENYENTGKWNLIHVKNMEDFINPSIAETSVIESMKAIMTSTAQDYHTTLVFSTTDPQQLDEVAIESNRVQEIDITEAFDFEEAHKKSMFDRLNDEKYIKNSPLCAINDMLAISGDKQYKLNFDNSKQENVKDAKEYIIEHMPFEYLESYASVLDEAIENAWYIAR